MAESPIFFESDTPGTPKRGPQPVAPGTTVIVQQSPVGGWQVWGMRLLMAALAISILFNLALFAKYHSYLGEADGPQEKFHSGDVLASRKIAVLEMSATIMPPYTERIIQQIKKAAKDKDVKGVLLVIDSPGGLVADSHEIYHELKKLSRDKPLFVQMKRVAASGGYYIAMGGGPQAKIYAEPTTWTGSIGVIMPRYDISQLADKFGVKSEPLTTGEFKDSLSPFKPLTERERELWSDILNQSYEQFLAVIDENRDTLDLDKVKEIATGQVFTAKDAKAKGLIDEIGFQEDALDALKAQLGLDKVRVVKYQAPTTLMDVLIGNAQTEAKAHPWQVLLEASVPRAYYYCSWLPPLPE
jgi:protease-4